MQRQPCVRSEASDVVIEKSVGVPDKVPVSDAVQGSDGGDLGNGAVMSGGGEIVRERFRTLF